MNIAEYIKNNILFLDGGMGTLLQEKGLKAGEYPETWNNTHKEIITDIHKAYFDAGSNVVNTNTFGANGLKFKDEELEEIIKSAVECAKKAKELSSSKQEKFIALDVGPLGKLLKPLGDLEFEDAVSVFAKTVKTGVKYGVDLIFIETMNDSLETKAAFIAAKENSSLPVFVSNAYGENNKLMTGSTPGCMVTMLEGMRADAIGINCSLGPAQLKNVVEEVLEYSSTPVILKPNAGLPKVVDGKTVFDVSPSEFASQMAEYVKKGVRIVGGCCGTTPEYIKELVKLAKDIKPAKITEKKKTTVSSFAKVVEFGEKPVLIGERINPTGKKLLKQALVENNIDYILKEGINQQEKGVDILDVNVGLPEINEPEMLERVSRELYSICDLPLCIDTSDVSAMERALRIYNGKALVNSVNGRKDSMEKVFPIVKKYGGTVICLTLDENGIPDNYRDRVEIAKKIIKNAEKFGIEKENLVFDTLAMTVSADINAAKTTLKSAEIIKNELKCHTSLGISNVSFGLPKRDAINSTFFAMALERGLSCAIMNPYSEDMMKVYYSFVALKGQDNNFENYISFTTDDENKKTEKEEDSLKNAIKKGLKEQAAKLTENMLKKSEGLDIVNNEIIPALDEIGKGFESNKVFLPQLLMSAEAAGSAFDVIKASMKSDTESFKGLFVLATVKGDIHDIGKNIVKLLLENYGFKVYDLGKDVPPRKIVDKVLETKAKIVGLSALMTTTVPAMEETIKLLKKDAPDCKAIVGGAVLTKDYAEKIGADKYAKDAMDTVRYAESIYNN